jgi:hypothetical protein
MSTVCAAATKRPITPRLDDGPVYLARFQANRPAAGVHDDLYVRTTTLTVEFVFPSKPFRPGAHYEETMSPSRYATPLLMEAWIALIARAAQDRGTQ